MNLKHLTDKSLLFDTKRLAQRYREVTTKLLHHLKEIDDRKLYAELGHHSLFDYVVKELGFSEPSAARRISAARLLKDVPGIEKKIENGDLTLSNLAKAAQTFKNEKITDPIIKKEILSKIEHKSARECEKTLFEFTSPISVKPLNKIILEVDDSVFEKFQSIKGLLAHKKLSLNDLMDLVFSLTIQTVEKSKFKTTARGPIKESTTRFIPASLKKAVFERDQRCTKCGSKTLLEYDHIKSFSMGGKTELNNLRILCRPCNQRARLTQNLTATYHRNT